MLVCGSFLASTSAAVSEGPCFLLRCVGVAGTSSCLLESFCHLHRQGYSQTLPKVRPSQLFGIHFFHGLCCHFCASDSTRARHHYLTLRPVRLLLSLCRTKQHFLPFHIFWGRFSCLNTTSPNDSPPWISIRTSCGSRG